MRPYRSFAAAAGAVALGAFAVQPAFAATALEGALFQQAQSRTGPETVTGQGMNTWSAGAPEDLAANATATAVSGQNSVTSRAKINASWSSADFGQVNVLDHGWTFDAPVETLHTVSADLRGDEENELDWSYTFMATEESTFELDFNLLGTGDLFGLGHWDLLFFAGGGGPSITQLSDGFGANTTLSGNFSRALTAGQTYRVALRNAERFTLLNPTDNALVAKETGSFDWRIVEGSTAVPEPAAWAMMIAGFGLAGATLRRRRGALA